MSKWKVLSFKNNLPLGDDIIEAPSKYDAKQIAKRKYKSATEFKITSVNLDTSSGVICPYCNKQTEFVDSKLIYGKSYGMIYLCRKCDAYVGTHKNSKKPLGTPANFELRELRKITHLEFDKIWQEKYMSRRKAYLWLANKLGLPLEQTHIGMFNINKCNRVLEVTRNYFKELKTE